MYAYIDWGPKDGAVSSLFIPVSVLKAQKDLIFWSTEPYVTTTTMLESIGLKYSSDVAVNVQVSIDSKLGTGYTVTIYGIK